MSNYSGYSEPPNRRGFSEMMLFWASFLTLIAAGMAFSITNDILREWGAKFSLTQTELGEITGMGLAGFGLTIIVFSLLADWIGYGRLMVIAFMLHIISVGVTLAAPYAYQSYGKPGAFWCLYLGQLSMSLANGTCEAVINPLTASLFPRNKTHWLNILHAGWPGGLVLGAVVGLGLNQLDDIGWQIRWGIVLAPILMYGVLMVGRRFPTSEAREHGVSIREMMGVVGMLGAFVVMALIGLWLTTLVPAVNGLFGKVEFLSKIELPDWTGWAVGGLLWIGYGFLTRFSPGHVILMILYMLHALIGYVELGTDRWIVDITKIVMADQKVAGVVLDARDVALAMFIWTNVLMFGLRFFAGPIVARISPVGLLFVSAVLGTTGLYLLGQDFTDNTWAWLGAVTVYGIGKTFYWPTMLGVISERYPKGGAVALGVSGGVGMLAAGLLGASLIGYKQDYATMQFMQKPDYAITYQRYKAEEPKPPLPYLESVAGLDNGKVGVLEDNAKDLNRDLSVLRAEGKTNEELEKRLNWWETQGKKFSDVDAPRVKAGRHHGGKTALYWTAAVPFAMAVGYLLLIIVFRAQGGYAQVHIGDEERRQH